MSGWQSQEYRPPQQYGPPPQQQVAPYQPQGWQPQGWQPQYPPAYAQPYQQPAVVPKSTGTGLVLGLLFPGVGAMYAGKPWIGALVLAAWLVSVPLFFVMLIGFFTGLAAWIASAILGYALTKQWNAEHGFVS